MSHFKRSIALFSGLLVNFSLASPLALAADGGNQGRSRSDGQKAVAFIKANGDKKRMRNSTIKSW